VDLHRYDEAWELYPVQALSQFVDSISTHGATFLDLRRPGDFAGSHVPGACSLPLRSLGTATPSPFSDALVLESQWKELEATFTPDCINAHDLLGKDVYVMCYVGDTARVATSVLRAKGIQAWSVRGGHEALRSEVPSLQMSSLSRDLEKRDWLHVEDVDGRELRADSLVEGSEVVVGPP